MLYKDNQFVLASQHDKVPNPFRDRPGNGLSDSRSKGIRVAAALGELFERPLTPSGSP